MGSKTRLLPNHSDGRCAWQMHDRVTFCFEFVLVSREAIELFARLWFSHVASRVAKTIRNPYSVEENPDTSHRNGGEDGHHNKVVPTNESLLPLHIAFRPSS